MRLLTLYLLTDSYNKCCSLWRFGEGDGDDYACNNERSTNGGSPKESILIKWDGFARGSIFDLSSSGRASYRSERGRPDPTSADRSESSPRFWLQGTPECSFGL